MVQVVVTLMVGVSSGLGGMALGLLLHAVQHFAYGYGLHPGTLHESFLDGVTGTSAQRRLVVLTVCGLIAGCGWWSIYRFGRPLISIRKAVAKDGPRMPFFTTAAHDILQIVTVALGSPLGREVAPRELGAVLATKLCDWARLSPATSRILIACGAGAGLAAVYNVPLGGAVFTLEVLLETFSFPVLIAALTTSVLAAVIAWIGLGNVQQYSVPVFALSPSLVLWSIAAGPIFGLAAYWFVRLTSAARAQSPRSWRILLWCGAVFLGIGLLAIRFPELLGNGRGVAELSMQSDLAIKTAAVLFVLRLLVSTAALRAGAEGGLLTPGLTLGALLAVVVGSLWNHAAPVVPLGAFAIVGAAAFLASSMKMPLTAIVLALEFTRVGHDFLIPITFAVAGSASISYLCRVRSKKTEKTAQESILQTH